MQSITTAFLLAEITPDKPDMQDCAVPMTATGKGFVEMYPAVTKTSASLSLAILFPTKAETALLQAIILMLFHEAPEYEQNFSMVMRVLEYAEVKEEDEEYVSPLDLLFQAMERDDPNSVAVHQYKVFKMAAGKTSKSSAAALPRSLHSNT